MNPKYERELEASIDHELKSLPQLSAPVTLLPQVMARIGLRAAIPWHRRSWQTWPLVLRAGSLGLMLALFGTLCFAGWQVSNSDMFAAATRKAIGWLSGPSLVLNLLNVLGGSVLLVIKQLGAVFIAACVAAALLSYAVSLTLGTACWRLAVNRR
jgi:hypothetical protein